MTRTGQARPMRDVRAVANGFLAMTHLDLPSFVGAA
jgi:hypothetical protein